MNSRSYPAVSIHGRAGRTPGHANDVLEINHFRSTVGVKNSTSLNRSESLITCEYDCKANADETS